MRQNFVQSALLACTFPFAAVASALPAPAQESTAPATWLRVKVDHHVHVDSPEISEYLKGLCAQPKMKEMCDGLAPRSAEDLLREMDAAGIAKARLLSTGYLAENQFMVPQIANHAQLVHSANAFTVALAKQHPDRLQAFISINPVSPTAFPELAYWKGNPAVAGLKLHLANSGFDFHNRNHVKRLIRIFATAAANRLSIVVHMRNREAYGAGEAAIFIRDILPAARGMPVQIAHIAGWFGIDDAALSALGKFAEAFERKPGAFANVTFDLAAVRPDQESFERRDALVRLMRRIGVAHFVPASDWPVEPDLKVFYAGLRTLPLTSKEFEGLANIIGK